MLSPARGIKYNENNVIHVKAAYIQTTWLP
jgi:hypothetical protein